METSLQDKDIVDLEVERIRLLFKKNNYDREQKIWFIESKWKNALNNKDQEALSVCQLLLKELNQ